MTMQMFTEPSPQNQIVDLRLIDGSGVESSKFEDGVVLSLVHLDMAFAMKMEVRDLEDSAGEAPCFKVSAKRLAPGSRLDAISPVDEGDEDPIIRRLADALAVTEAAHNSHSAICADALRLAILTRQFTQQADFRRGVTAPEECQPVRCARSLPKWRLKRVLEYVDQNIAEKISLQDLAMVAGLSRMHFAAQFRAAMGIRPHEYLLKQRIDRAGELLKQDDVPLVEVALTVGFQTQAHFTTVFKRFTGDTPYQWRCAYLAQSTSLPVACGSLS